MTGSLVDRATTDLLIGPDWAMNLEICDILNHNPSLAKDVVKGLKRRIQHKNPKVQLLALTLLETIIKNCGDMVHMHVAEKNLPHEMVKIVKRKPDFNVNEKILGSIDTWQEAFGGPRARYLQFYSAYQELLHMGAVFPKRPETSAPFFTSPVKYSLSSYPKSPGSSDHREEASETSAGSDFPTFSVTDLQNARGVVDVLSEMLAALDPGDKEGLRQDVILDLVQQCLSYRRGLVHLLNTTSDEDMLSQALALHDDLYLVLAKHDACAVGVAVRVEKRKTLQPLVDIDDPSVTNPDSSRQSAECLRTDLLSIEDLNTCGAENQLALVPVGEPLNSSATDQNALVLSDVLSQSNSNNFNNGPTTPFDQHSHPSNLELTLYSNEYEQSPYQGANDHCLPPPPWETQLDGPYNYNMSYDAYYSQRPPYNYNLQDTYSNSNARPYHQMPATSYVPQFNRPSKPEDKLFGDLVNMAKAK